MLPSVTDELYSGLLTHPYESFSSEQAYPVVHVLRIPPPSSPRKCVTSVHEEPSHCDPCTERIFSDHDGPASAYLRWHGCRLRPILGLIHRQWSFFHQH